MTAGQISPGERYGHRVVVRELEKGNRGQRYVLVRCLICNREQRTRLYTLRSSTACLACSNADYRSPEERLWDKAEPEPNSGCWLWSGSFDALGYGVFVLNGRKLKAHREALRFSGVEIRDGQIVCHRCDNPSCVNPDHLYAGTPKTNADDREARKRGGGARRRGAGNGRAKLSAQQVAEIRKLWASGLHTKRALGRRFGVSDVQVGFIVSGSQWVEKECEQ